MNDCGNEYIQLLSSLPRMPSQLTDDYHPITDISLAKRLRMLSAGDCRRLDNIRDIVLWARIAKLSQQQDWVVKARAVLQAEADTELASLIYYRLDVRSLIAALNARHRKITLSGHWTVSRLKSHIEAQWQATDFGLAKRFAWIDKADALVRSGHSMELEQLVAQLCWQNLQRNSARLKYSFESVVVYVLQWDLFNRRQGWDSELAQKKFDQLLTNFTLQKEWQDVFQQQINR